MRCGSRCSHGYAWASVRRRARSTQANLYARPATGLSSASCHFYHVMEIPGHGMVGGDWDLRGREDAYLGGVDLAGRRVLEIGPASGFLTFWMESQGADVVGVELAPDAEWDFVPNARLDLDRIRTDRRAIMERLRNGYWFAHERFGSTAKVHHGSVYDLPPELGRFDLAVLGSVLLHLRDPLRALEQCARRADRIVVTDAHFPELDGPLARLEPAPDSDTWDTWWRMSPELVVRFLAVLGLDDANVTFHEQRHVADGHVYPIPMFTVVAGRRSAL
jgi:SAM-dependent methyltransferase